ncbi:exo-beta-N-acetylmuramidase NamZ family protein [Echinicola shivajiensis]|uniref:exo-beta-N-acetylmuramidase NamZ family protein n=1 Tax=Echinicola shivajiensis TaxID=1035916 RepID=UPI001BFC2285|nr:DUF1343 domain-containing protein [Echinicola shivajiensis]
MIGKHRIIRIAIICLVGIVGYSCDNKAKEEKGQLKEETLTRVVIGAERLFEPDYFSMIEGKKVALVTNHTGLLPDGRHLVDVLYENKKVDLTLLFGPEHGIRGEEDNHVSDGADSGTGLPVISLYGKVRKPSAEMLEGIEVIIFDIQDIGARFYTYIATMNHVLEAAAENDIPYLVLDRPNAIGGVYVDGPVGELQKEPVVGVDQLPVVHGMTVGELVNMFNEERSKKGLKKADLTVVKMEHYDRNKWYDEAGLPWIKPSPNMLTLTTAALYPMTCLLEGTNMSEARGTLHPFEHIGATWVDGKALADKLNGYQLEGVEFIPSQFTPEEVVDGIKIYPPKFLGEQCESAFIKVTNRDDFASAQAGVYMMKALYELYPEKLEWKAARMDRLMKTPSVREGILNGENPASIIQQWSEGLAYFKKVRSCYLLY